jgi:hypothetical protein
MLDGACSNRFWLKTGLPFNHTGYTDLVMNEGGKMTEVVGLFATRMDAQNAIDSLDAMGYNATSVGFLDRQRDGDVDVDAGPHKAVDEGAKGVAGGAVGGAAVGAGAGLLASAGLAFVPGIGPFLAAGTLLGTLGATAAGAAGGAVLGGAAGTIFGSATDDEHATYYRQGVEEGGSLVTVAVDDGATSQVASVLHGSGAKKVDIHGETGWVV